MYKILRNLTTIVECEKAELVNIIEDGEEYICVDQL